MSALPPQPNMFCEGCQEQKRIIESLRKQLEDEVAQKTIMINAYHELKEENKTLRTALTTSQGENNE